MTYVWLEESSGSMRYVDDIYLSPCPKCGLRVSKCREADVCNKPVEEVK